MEEVHLRFPHLGERIFRILLNKDLVNCKIISRSWYHFIVNQKFYNQKVYYENLQKEVDVIGDTPLHRAVKDGNLQKCKLIIDHVENKNPANMFGKTPLHNAAECGNLEICKLIVEKVEDKNPATKYGWTPLHSAAVGGQLKICRFIIDNVSNKHPLDSAGRTPKFWADKNNHAEISQLFEF